MSVRLLNQFGKERAAGRHLFVPFITAGDRGLGFTKKAIAMLSDCGADAIELGVPFSDPLADGPVIQQSSQRALAKGTTLEAILEMVKEVRSRSSVPLVLMGYLNPFLQPSLAVNLKKIHLAGVDGMIIPDLPLEEAGPELAMARQWELDTIFLATPTSTEERLKAIGRLSTGYVYYVSVTGTTGARTQLPQGVAAGVSRLRQYTSLPVLVGFGISTPVQARAMTKAADGVIVGSALVRAMAEAKTDQAALKKLGDLARAIAVAVKK